MRLDKWGRRVCECGGYHFPHREGSGACDHSPTVGVHRALRTEDPDAILEARIEYTLSGHAKPDVSGECPF